MHVFCVMADDDISDNYIVLLGFPFGGACDVLKRNVSKLCVRYDACSSKTEIMFFLSIMRCTYKLHQIDMILPFTKLQTTLYNMAHLVLRRRMK